MSNVSDAFLAKARESLTGATSEFANRRYNNAANRAYYACFQAAIAALEAEGVRPTGGSGQWSHTFVQGQFAGLLINRRKVYPADLVDALSLTQQIREQADYKTTPVTQRQMARALSRAQALVTAVLAREGSVA